MYTMAAQRGLAPDADLLFAMQLNMLMYSGISDLKSATRAFQSDLGDPANGDLTVHQIHQLEYRAELQKLSPVGFPESFSSRKTADYGIVEGTLTILDEKIAWPINHYTIKCFKSDKTCEVQQIMLSLPDEKSWTQRYNVMIVSTEYYNISRWSDQIIDAEYPSKEDSCRTSSLNLNFKTKEFFLITKNAGGTCEILGKKIEKLPKPRISQIVDGKKLISSEFANIEKMAYEVLSSEFRKRVQQINSPNQQKVKIKFVMEPINASLRPINHRALNCMHFSS